MGFDALLLVQRCEDQDHGRQSARRPQSTSWPDDDASQRAASKKWCDSFVTKLGRFHVTTYLNNAMPESEAEMLGVFPQGTLKRLRALKEKHDPHNLFKMGAWQYKANK